MPKILVVDDESNMRFLLRMIFEPEGYEVLEAGHGAAAIELIAESRPDLVVTDVMMPVMDGRELVERLRSDPQTAAIPILVVSASTKGFAGPADAVVTKPFDIDALLAAAQELSSVEGGG